MSESNIPPTDAGLSDEPLTEDPRPDGLRSAASLVVLNTGNGKGKSSSAFGMMVRGLAVDWNVAVCQFIKSGDWRVGEEKMGRKLGVEWHSFGDGFTWDSDNLDHDATSLVRGGQKRLQLSRPANTSWSFLMNSRTSAHGGGSIPKR